MDSTKKFDGRAKDYTAARPSYAAALIDCLYSSFDFSADSVIADIGSGTGKFAAHLLEKGSTVCCVEPNEDMRRAAEKVLSGYEKFRSVNGGAEDTTLADDSVDHITTAQAFHWFDTEKFRRECSRIIRKGGKVALIWNVRDISAPVNRELHSLFTRFCPDFHGFSGGITQDDDRIKQFFGGAYDHVSFDNPLYLDRERFISRCLSGSYSLKEGDPDYPEYIKAVKALFDKYAADGIVTVPNRSEAYIGTVK